VKKYLDLIGGTITMNSEPGKGTKFELKFPLHKNNGNKLIITKQG
jgi:signal transduction histidine kinase